VLLCKASEFVAQKKATQCSVNRWHTNASHSKVQFWM